jgi:ribonuclease-3
MDDADLTALQERLGFGFKDAAYLRRALTHRSAACLPAESNERMEFFGDSIVGLIVSEMLYRRFPDYSEGELAKAKSYVVSEPSLAEAARALGIENWVQMSAGEAATGGRNRRSILADAFEALVAAVYLDSGIRSARSLVRRCLDPRLRDAAAADHYRDYKSALQERVQARLRQAPVYRIAQERGREHEKTFTAEAIVGERVIGTGQGGSKKEAEQAAAYNALERLDEHFPETATESRSDNGFRV